MSTAIHFIDVGQGNMVLIEAENGQKFICDCNVTNENSGDVLRYLSSVIGWRNEVSAFICTHRDADHMRGVRRVHDIFPIKSIWDSDYPGTTTDSVEYFQYMQLRRNLGSRTIEKLTRRDFGRTRFRYLSAKDNRLPKNANNQGIVLKIEHLNDHGICGSSTILTGDCDAQTWRLGIMQDYSKSDVSADILMGGHHGSITFFDDPADSKKYYTGHIEAINPAMTIISVGDNPHGHPDSKAIELYEGFSRGSRKGNKVFTTQKKGTMKLTLKDNGWTLNAV